MCLDAKINMTEDDDEEGSGCGRNCLGNCCIRDLAGASMKLPLYTFKAIDKMIHEKYVVEDEKRGSSVAFLDSLILGEASGDRTCELQHRVFQFLLHGDMGSTQIPSDNICAAMALPIGKLTILVGAGILGSVLVKEAGMSNVSDFLSGAYKIFVKQIQRDDSTPSAKPRNDALLAQVNSLRQELQLLASNRSVIIINRGRSGAGTYGVPVVVVIVVGYGYIWWKGWKLSDMMFATRRGLSEARTAVAKQLEQCSASISQTKRFLSSRIDRVDCKLDEFAEITAATKEEISEVKGDVKMIGVDVESVHQAVQTLETRIVQISGKQDLTNRGVQTLCSFVWELEQNRTPERIQASPSSSSRPALELPRITPTSRTSSSPPELISSEPPASSASDKSLKVSRSLQSAVSAPGLKVLEGMTNATDETLTAPEVNNRVQDSEDGNRNGSSSSSWTGWIPVLGGSFLTRKYSATYSK
ncbi:hypothetical protein NE237_020066 [Protea cynaroides]|uniref:DUF1664 domain-containing protein n=1 Tax=Protea cynaroides TaxID=273540 RepID=A0A9Q0H5A5_9MAGN|nr:hypothetical protein NE237_020066 [Protea cynaroides]